LKKISKPSQYTDSRELADGSLTFPRERGKANKQAHSKPTQQKPNSKAGQLVGNRADLQNLRTTYKLKLPHPTKGGADQAAASERQKKKKKNYPTTW
jgi:hypothetical protein